MDAITSFSGQYRWLSNFSPAPISLGGSLYPTVEAAFQAAKTLDPAQREAIRLAPTPTAAKRLGRQVNLRDDWDDIRINVMRACIRSKFSREPLRRKLLATGDAELVEGNTWGDCFWGVCGGVGQNWLGKLLMETRAELYVKAS